MKLAAFVYDFPHKKSQDFLLHLLINNYNIEVMILGHLSHINKPEGMRTKPVHTGLINNLKLYNSVCKHLLWCEHNSEAAINALREHEIDIGVIAGARMLNRDVIDVCKIGIINVHPGLVPDTRGQDSLKWAVHEGKPLGITAHLIDEKVDAGRILVREQIEVFPDDTWVDLSLRLEEVQPNIMIRALKIVESGGTGYPANVTERATSYFPKEMEGELDLEKYKRMYC